MGLTQAKKPDTLAHTSLYKAASFRKKEIGVKQVDIHSPKLLSLAMGITTSGRLVDGPGIRPVIISHHAGDVIEFWALAIRVAGLSGLSESATLMRAEDFEGRMRRGAPPGAAIVITDGENISRAVQARMVARDRSGLAIPPGFIVATDRDPGDLVSDGRWVFTFREIFHRHWPFPKINDRKSEWPKLFRQGVEMTAERTNAQIPEIDANAYKMVKALPLREEDGAQALVRLGEKSFRRMVDNGEARIRSPHVLVSLPGTSSPPPRESQQASAS